jgi:tetratricopeptide (TPR) repeat protein
VAPRIELPKPDPKDLSDIDARLAALASEDAAARDNAARELLEADARLVPALAFRLDSIADRADKEAMKRLFEQLRKESREQGRSESEETPRGAASPDYLTMLVKQAHPDKKPYQDLVAVVGISRMLSAIGSVEAVRTLINVYTRFGEFLRIATQRELTRLGDKAVPALIEARRHPAEKIARWANRQLDTLGRAVPGEAVRVSDPQVLADVLRAYGRIRDPDATRIVVSFANSERGVVREAARQSIALFGEVAMWQLKDTYESIVGKKPPRDWSWERTARELFAEFDRSRSAVVADVYAAGRAARAKGDFEAMRKAFDEVLARDPRFEPKNELIAGYLEYAKRAFDDHPADAEIALLRAERLTDAPAERAKIQSQVLTLRAIESVRKNVADVTLLERALDLDRGNARAETLLSELRHGKRKRSDERSRQVAAGTIGLLSLLGIAALLRKRPEDRVDPAPEPKPEPVDPNAQTMLAPPSMLPNPSAPAADIEEPKLDVNADADLDETKKLGTANEPAKE